MASLTMPRSAYLLPAVLLLALCLRLLGLDQQSLSMDEVAELNIARSAVGKIVFVQDGFPPLYQTILHGWLKLFPGDTAARGLSVLLGTMSVWVVWSIGRRVGGDRTAFWAALLVAASPFHIWHSQESRAYIQYYLLASLALWSFFTALETNSTRAWLSYIVACLAGLLTHYYFALLVLSTVATLLIEFRGRPRRTAILAHAVIVGVSLPVLWLLRGDLSSEASVSFPTQFHLAAIGYTLFSFIAGYAVGPSPRELHEMAAGRAIINILPWLLVTGAAAGVLLYHGLRRLGPRRWTARLVVLTALPVTACVVIAGILGITFQVRHVLWASISLLIVLGAGASEFRRHRTAALAVAALFVVFGISQYNRHNLAEYQTEDVRGLAAYLQATNQSAFPVFVVSGYMAEPLRHYLSNGWVVYPMPDVRRTEKGLTAALQYLESKVRPGSTFWLVYTRGFHGDPQGHLLQELIRSDSLQRRAEFAGVILYYGNAD